VALPWEADRELSPATAVSVITAQFPHLAPVALQWLDEGWDHEVYRVNDTWAFRFPKRREVVPWVEREIGVTRLVSSRLGIPVPRFELVGRPGAHFPYPFVGYRFLPGVPANTIDMPAEALIAAAAQLGEALAELHAIPAENVRPLGAPVEEEGPREWLQDCVADADSICAGLGDHAAHWESYLHGDVPVPDAAPRRCLVHNDLGHEHILVNERTARVTAIIDWADAAIADPALDFIGIYIWGGEGMVSRALEHYTVVDDQAAFMARLRYVVVTRVLTWIGETQQQRPLWRGETDWARWLVEVGRPRYGL
jgi:aminoglycoside phosphotransferase (APT) family kinase protein